MPLWENKEQVKLMKLFGGLYASWGREDVIELTEEQYQREINTHVCDITTRWKKILKRKGLLTEGR